MNKYPTGLSLVNELHGKRYKYNIVFIHGLNGDAYETWVAKEENSYWPRIISENLNNAKVWTLGYDIKASSWQGHTMPMYDRAINTLEWLSAYLIDENPIIFIGHSFGGLLIKQILKIAQTATVETYNKILQRTYGVVFVSTPHTGADLASYLDCLSLVTRSSVNIKELKPHNPYLRELNDWYRNNAPKLHIQTLSFFETKKTGNFLIINPDSGNPCISGSHVIPLDEDHFTICRPKSKYSLINLKTIDFIKEVFKKKE